MKIIELSILAIILCCLACNNQSSTSDVTSDVEEKPAMNGTFAREYDTLIIEVLEESFGKSIDFDITSRRPDENQRKIFNQAALVNQTEEFESYQLKYWVTGDSSYVAYELTDFSYNYDNDNWTVTDSLVITDPTYQPTPSPDLDGTYTRVK